MFLRKLILLLIATFIFHQFSMAQDFPAYQLFSAEGKKLKFKKVMQQLEAADIILFGELHNDPIAHWLQLEVARRLAASEQPLIIGAEMFEADNQGSLSLYVQQSINAETFAEEVRLWPNYETDYAPLVDFAREEWIPVIATNIPRKYATEVYHHGFESLDTLSAEEKAWMAPLPIPYDPTLPGYKAMLDTMAHFILQNWEPERVFLHLNGSYHSDNYEGILWYLQQQQPDLNYITISTVLQADLEQLSEENKGVADVVLVVREGVGRTY